MDAADIAADYFDQNVCPTEQKRKYLTRYARLEESIENNDGTLLFIKDKERFLGYVRVMPITIEQWESYYDSHKISEAEFLPQHHQVLGEGKAHIYIQAIVFPDGGDLGIRNKLALQESAIAGLIGNLLPETMPDEGINVYFTALHPYTDKFAKRLKIPPVGQNKSGCSIYGFNISKHAPDHSLGSAIYKRWQEDKKPFTHLRQESHDAPTHPHVHSPDHLRGREAMPQAVFANLNKD